MKRPSINRTVRKNMSIRERLDVLVVARGLLSSRVVARTAIMDGLILVNGQKVTKAGQNIDVHAKLELIPSFRPKKYVSRGGLKLEAAIAEFDLTVKDRICLDIGASTGGFTDCLLQHGAIKVYAVDVGYGQFDFSLRNDSKVVLKERQNIRYLTKEDLYGASNREVASLAVIDVSFISLELVLPNCCHLLSEENAEIICLIKPQFEVGKGMVGRGGVVKSTELQVKAIDQVFEAALVLKLMPVGLTYSPIRGPAGNLEFLLHLKRDVVGPEIDIERIVEDARGHLYKTKPQSENDRG